MFSNTDQEFPFKSYKDVLDATDEKRITAKNREEMKVKMDEAAQYIANMSSNDVCWAFLQGLMDEVDQQFVDSIKSKRDQIDMRLLIGMEDASYDSRIDQYLGALQPIFKEKLFDRSAKETLTNEKAVCKAVLYKMAFLGNAPHPRWPFLSKSPIVALSDSLLEMHEGLKEVSSFAWVHMVKRRACMNSLWH
jgi:hypothetical protein